MNTVTVSFNTTETNDRNISAKKKQVQAWASWYA